MAAWAEVAHHDRRYLALWPTAHFWWWIGGAAAAGLAGHFFYRWKTHGWTQAWGWWDHVEDIDRD